MAIDMKPVEIGTDYYTNKTVAIERGLITAKQNISHIELKAKLTAYNESLVDDSDDVTIYKYEEDPLDEKDQIAIARKALIARTPIPIEVLEALIPIKEPVLNLAIEVPEALIPDETNEDDSEDEDDEEDDNWDDSPIKIKVPEVPVLTALDEAAALLQGVNPTLAAQLKEQFRVMKELSKKAPAAKKVKVPKSEKILAAILKMKTVFEAYQGYILAGKVPSQAKMNVAVDRESSSGAVHLCCIGYKLYRDYPAITKAVDEGTYLTTALALDGVNTERSKRISKKLGIDIIVSIDY